MQFSVSKIGVSHEDERRKLTAVFNGDFTARQIKILNIKKTSILGNHYHNYPELFYVYRGQAIFTLVSVDTKEREEVILSSGDRLIIGPRIAHRAVMPKGVMTIEATEQPYMSSVANDVRYDIE